MKPKQKHIITNCFTLGLAVILMLMGLTLNGSEVRAANYIKIGLPLTLVVFLAIMIGVPLFWEM